MNTLLFPDEESLASGQPSRDEFNALLGRIKALERKSQQITNDDEVNNDSNKSDCRDDDDGTRIKNSSSSSPAVTAGPAVEGSGRRLGLSFVRFFRANEGRQLEELELLNDKYPLPESMFTFFITEPVLSLPCVVGYISYLVCLASLSLALMNELDNGTDDNPYGIAEVTTTVRMAQYLSVIIGVLIDEEIPLGLELIGKAFEQTTEGDRVISRSRIIFSSILRFSIGYMFLTTLFFVVVQTDNVLQIFFDMVALEFVESIDDIIFELCKRGFFGRRLNIAANQDNVLQCSSSSSARTLRKWSNRFIRLMYFASAFVMVIGLSFIANFQMQGAYGCSSLILQFGDGTWKNAWVMLDKQCSVDSDCNANQKCYSGDGFCYEQRLLIYSFFNGYYNQDGVVGQRPRYVEMSKEKKDQPFHTTIPAYIMYCEDIKAWVLTHPKIRTSLDSDQVNECNWLLRSEQTEEFDVGASAEPFWFLWKGQIEDDYKISVHCAECASNADCNYFGTCVDQSCECFPGRFGGFCEDELPCEVIRSEKDPNVTLKLVKDLDPDDDNLDFVRSYGRPMYTARMQGKPYGLMRHGYPGEEERYFEVDSPVNASVIVPPHKHPDPDDFSDDDFFQINNKSVAFQNLLKNYTFVLRYTGRRWYGQLVDPTFNTEMFKEEEYHAFWWNSFSGLGQEDNSTLIISEPAVQASPVNIDFFEMRRRNIVFEEGMNYDYSQYGVTIPLLEIAGVGFFHCNRT